MKGWKSPPGLSQMREPLYNSPMMYKALFFDLDDTLYSHENGLWAAIRERMGQFMAERLSIPPDQVPAIRRQYYERYGTTLRGLQLHYAVDADEYLRYVHDLPLEQYIQPAPRLRQLLLHLRQPRWIFTNADVDHAHRVLSTLGVSDCFCGIIDIRALGFVCKPDIQAYQRALTCAGLSEANGCVLFDDSIANLAAARRLGFTTVWVHENSENHSEADFRLADLLELPDVLPELWANGER